MAGGFIALHRQILDWEWYSDINTFRLFVHLLLKANYKPLRFEGQEIERGQLVTSLTRLASQTGLSVRQIRVSLDHLKMTGEVTVSSYPRYSVITISKYDEYQSDDRLNDRQMTRKVTGKRHADDTLSDTLDDSQMTTSKQYNNNNKEIKEQGNNNNTFPASRENDRLDDFETFWQAYPKKVSKPDAIKAWKKIKPDGLMQMEIIRGLMRWKGSDQWTRDGGQYIPYPATWLNRRGWEDECPAARPERKPEPAKPPARVTAQEYEQRDYTGVDDDLMDEQARMIEDALRRGII